MDPGAARQGREQPQTSPALLLLITDDWDLSLTTARALKGSGFTLRCESNVAQGVRCAVEGGCRLVLIDAVQRGADVVQLVRDVRTRSVVPLIVIAKESRRAGLASVLEAGADDFVSVLVEPDEIVARVRAVLRRGPEHRVSRRIPIEFGDLRIEPAARVVNAGGRKVELTAIEFDILECLAREAGRTVSRDELMAVACGRAVSPLDRALDVHISHVRRKLRDHGRLIVTVRGVGYMLAVHG